MLSKEQVADIKFYRKMDKDVQSLLSDREEMERENLYLVGNCKTAMDNLRQNLAFHLKAVAAWEREIAELKGRVK